MRVWHRATPSQPRAGARRGQITALFGLTLFIMIGALALGIDLSRLRAEAENAQRAANAAALAGVVFLPDFTDSARYRALEEARKNGFVGGHNGVAISAVPVPGFSNRLKVTISEPVGLFFGAALGLPRLNVSRTAVAEYSLPLEMGSPDYVMGYPFYPTTLVTPTTSMTPTEGYYLEIRGNYGFQDNGDAYSSFFEAYPGGTRFATNVGAAIGYTTSPPFPNDGTSGCTFQAAACGTVRPNPDRLATSFTGYDYVIDDPLTNTLVVKIFNPFDETSYYKNAVGNLKLSLPIAQPLDALGGTYNVDNSTNGNNHGRWIDSAGPSGSFNNFQKAATTSLQWQLYGPGTTATDASMPLIQTTPASATAQGRSCTAPAGPTASNCVIDSSGSWVAGEDPTVAKCSANSKCYEANPSPYAYQFLNYAIIHGKGVYRLHVSATVNVDGSYGTNGKLFGLAVCSAVPTLGSPSNVPATLGTDTDPSNGGLATTDPYTMAGATPGWNPAACASPNVDATGYGVCANPNLSQPGQCVHIYGLGRMCVDNILSGGTSLIPLGYVPPEYGGKTLVVRLYDVGDVSGANDYLEPLTPAGDLQHLDGNPNPATSGGFPSSLNYSFQAAPTDTGLPTGQAPNAGNGFSNFGPTQTQQTSPGDAKLQLPIGNTNGTDVPGSPGDPAHPGNPGVVNYEGSWLTMKIPILGSTTYPALVNQFGGYWKMQYHINGTSNDTTTWEINVQGSPVHLVAG